ncbi:MAG: hypothetical protein H6881_00070 [Rhodobiaceae bacterium]|nr:hypothetical protein [Hyphomonas sp.]MCB9961619.1 hypothetical protein [Hyphomonas sp.]MCB9971176.1 hypothetical protein [Hyphomonas sp.]MCC0050245.1 hypothetical protein [Rhodobiaceae bacterium]
MQAVSAALGVVTLALLLAGCGSVPSWPDERSAAAIPALDHGATLSLACSGCHSPAGGAIPSLEHRPAALIRQSLMDYKAEADGTTVMHRMMHGYSEADIDAISTYLARSATP